MCIFVLVLNWRIRFFWVFFTSFSLWLYREEDEEQTVEERTKQKTSHTHLCLPQWRSLKIPQLRRRRFWSSINQPTCTLFLPNFRYVLYIFNVLLFITYFVIWLFTNFTWMQKLAKRLHKPVFYNLATCSENIKERIFIYFLIDSLFIGSLLGWVWYTKRLGINSFSFPFVLL